MLIHSLGNGIINGSIIAVASLGFALVYQTSRIFHIAYAGLYTLAGYLFYYFFQLHGWYFIPALAVAVMLTGLVSLACEWMVYRPLERRNTGPTSLMVASIGLLIILVSSMELLFGSSPRIITAHDLVPAITSGYPANRVLLFASNMVLIITLTLILQKTRFGVIIRSLRDDVILAKISGINDQRYRTWIFLISGVLIAIIASFQSLDLGMNPSVGLPVFINAFIAMIIGGSGRFEGPVIGGFTLGLVQSLSEYFTESQWVVLVTFMILLGFLIFKPEGLLPERRREL